MVNGDANIESWKYRRGRGAQGKGEEVKKFVQLWEGGYGEGGKSGQGNFVRMVTRTEEKWNQKVEETEWREEAGRAEKEEREGMHKKRGGNNSGVWFSQ